jgi:hypothetical protein
VRYIILVAVTILAAGAIPTSALARQDLLGNPEVIEDDFQVLNVSTQLMMGDPGEKKRKDFTINAGTQQGIQSGSELTVFRRRPSYDLIRNRLYQDVTFPIAVIRVIHSEANVSIARLEKILPEDETPLLIPSSIMVGDLVRRRTP